MRRTWKTWAVAIAAGLAAGVMVCLAGFPSDKFVVDCRVKGEQFRIETDQEATPTWVFATYQGETNALDTTWSAAGYTMVLKMARSKDATAMLGNPITGVVSTVTTTFTVPADYLTNVVTDGRVWLLCYTNTRQVVFAEGRIDIRKAPMF
jgi:hypothetical protein